jgi:hypothetical protein
LRLKARAACQAAEGQGPSCSAHCYDSRGKHRRILRCGGLPAFYAGFIAGLGVIKDIEDLPTREELTSSA